MAARSIGRRRVQWLLCLSLALPMAGWAQQLPADLVPPEGAWFSGDFEQAYAAAVAVDSAASQLLASRAATDQAVYIVAAGAATESGEAAVLRWLDLAEAAAQRSIRLEPQGPYAAAAHLAWARARGEAALRSGLLDNLSVAPELRRAFDAALALSPDDADALVAYGMWHLELTQRGVGWLYGARRDQVLPLLRRGLSSAPQRIDLWVQVATALQALGMEEQAQEHLRTALDLRPVAAVDAFEQAKARAMLR